MTCMAALESMLEAELDELAGLGASPLATHLRACPRCRTVAAKLLADTRALASTVVRADSPAVGGPPVVDRRSLVAAGVLAAMLALAVWRLPSAPHERRATRETAPTPLAVASSAPVTGVVPAPAPAPAARSRRSVAASGAAGTVDRHRALPPAPYAEHRDLPYHPRAFEPVPAAVVTPVAVSRVEPVSIATPSAEGTGSRAPGADTLGITVDPGVGRRAVVMRTSNPRITVVWLY